MTIWETLTSQVKLTGVEINAGVVKLTWDLEKHDKELLRELWKCFARPAFYTPAEWEVSIDTLVIALSDTITGLGGGYLPIRDFTTRAQIEKLKVPRINDFSSRNVRKALKYVLRSLENLHSWLRREIERMKSHKNLDHPGHRLYVEDNDEGIAIGLSASFCNELNTRRQRILDVLNPILAEANCETIKLEWPEE